MRKGIIAILCVLFLAAPTLAADKICHGEEETVSMLVPEDIQPNVVNQIEAALIKSRPGWEFWIDRSYEIKTRMGSKGPETYQAMTKFTIYFKKEVCVDAPEIRNPETR